jgi:hypothetical protein
VSIQAATAISCVYFTEECHHLAWGQRYGRDAAFLHPHFETILKRLKQIRNF